MDRYIGLDAHESSCNVSVRGPSGKRLQCQVLETNAKALINFLQTIPKNRRLIFEEGSFIVHSVTHQLLGSMTSDELDYQLAREWILSTITDPPDTVGLNNFAWVGGGYPRFSYLSIERLIANGYKTCQGDHLHN